MDWFSLSLGVDFFLSGDLLSAGVGVVGCCCWWGYDGIARKLVNEAAWIYCWERLALLTSVVSDLFLMIFYKTYPRYLVCLFGPPVDCKPTVNVYPVAEAYSLPFVKLFEPAGLKTLYMSIFLFVGFPAFAMPETEDAFVPYK